MQIKYCILYLAAHFCFLNVTIAQNSNEFELSYQIDKIFPSISLSMDELADAETIMDLNRYYKPEWVEEYYYVDVKTFNNAKVNIQRGKNATLTPQQKQLMTQADENTEIEVSIHYLPKNKLKDNPPKTENFSFIVDPSHEAQFPGGQTALNDYIEQNIVSAISKADFRSYHLTAVEFSIDEIGQIVNVHVEESSGHDCVDEILFNAIKNMPEWSPARFQSGKTIIQDCVFLIGDRSSCVLNFFNVKDKRL